MEQLTTQKEETQPQKPKSKGKLVLIIIIILLLGNVFFGMRYFSLKQELSQTKGKVTAQNLNVNVIEFTNLFIEKVLKSGKEIDFETRLELENAVRDLDDKDILGQWKKFTQAQNQEEAQEEVKNLLKVLVGKIEVDKIE